ncbi:unnamed protein product [Colias eurytheme]|nr:unnamed protein product [Colias eurytheme]
MENQSHSNTNLLQSSENAAHIYINNYELPIHYDDTIPSQSTVKDEPPLKTLLEKNYKTLSKVKRSMSLDIKEENAKDIIISSGDDETDCLETISLDSDRLSYHSSDFEFIDEDEAKSRGLYSQNFTNKNNEYKPRRSNKNHIIPQGNDYLELFQGRYTPYPRTDMENKSTKSSRYPMYVGCSGIGFNMYGMPQNVSDELRNEAAENAKKIRQMYPAENRRRPRRYYR